MTLYFQIDMGLGVTMIKMFETGLDNMVKKALTRTLMIVFGPVKKTHTSKNVSVIIDHPDIKGKALLKHMNSKSQRVQYR